MASWQAACEDTSICDNFHSAHLTEGPSLQVESVFVRASVRDHPNFSTEDPSKSLPTMGVVYFRKALGESISKMMIPVVKFEIVKSG